MTWVEYGQSITGEGDREPELVAAFVVTTALAVIAVILRFISRRLAGAKLWIDDWLMLVGLFLSLVFTAAILFWCSIGLGQYIGLVTPQTLSPSYQVIFACEILYLFAVAVVKSAVIAFYWRILAHTRGLRIALYVFAAINIAWLVALFFTVLFQCTPVSGFWDKVAKQSCGVDFKAMLISNMIPNFLTDIALVLLPIYYIPPRINTTTIQKIVLYIIFALGFFVTVAPIVRLIYVARLDPHSRNVTWDFVDYIIWTGAEINVAIIAGCLPSMKPVLAKLVPAAMIPARLRESGRKDWIEASPDQTWLQEPVSVRSNSDAHVTLEMGLNRSIVATFQTHESGSQTVLLGPNDEMPMARLALQTSNLSDDSEYKSKPVMTVHEIR